LGGTLIDTRIIKQISIRTGGAIGGPYRASRTNGVACLTVDIGEVKIGSIGTPRITVSIVSVSLEGRAEGVALVGHIGIHSSVDATLTRFWTGACGTGMGTQLTHLCCCVRVLLVGAAD